MRWALRGVAAVLIAAVLVVTGTAYAVWKQARADERAPADAILVLGSAQYDGVPSPVFEARLDHAVGLFEEGLAPTIVTVGGKQDGDRFTEAEAGSLWLQGVGVPAEAIVAIGSGTNTLNSMEAVVEVYDEAAWSRLIIVTDPWHELRANRIAADLGMATFASPTRQGPAVFTRGTQFRAIVRETAAYLYYRLTGSTPETRIGLG
ncbi:MAG: YdcF family protein [Geodermatophilaceae bacterium]|nr:YdcF family protein [Geodermatophilaceae bacterium]